MKSRIGKKVSQTEVYLFTLWASGPPLGHTVATGQFFVIAFSGCGRFRIINDWHHTLLVFFFPHEFALVRYASWLEGALCTRRWR